MIMDDNFEIQSMYEAERPEVEKAIFAPGSTARNERGALSVSKFRSIGREVWRREGDS